MSIRAGVVDVAGWFGRCDLRLTTDANRRVVGQIDELLDQVRPARLNPAQQSVGPEDGETWVTLRHDSEPCLEIRIVVHDGWVNFYGVMGHDEAYSVRPDPPDS